MTWSKSNLLENEAITPPKLEACDLVNWEFFIFTEVSFAYIAPPYLALLMSNEESYMLSLDPIL